MKWYLKEIVSRPVYVKGALVRFEDFGDGNGGIVTDNELIIKELDIYVRKGVSGLVEVTQAQYEDAKKNAKPRVRPAVSNAQFPIRVSGGAMRAARAPAAPAPSVSESPGLVVPTSRIPKATPRIFRDQPAVVR